MEYVLRIFNGPYQGAEILLKHGSYSIGSSVASDIVINDKGVAENHMLISIVDSKPMIESKEGDVYLDGTKIKGKTSLELKQIVTIGNIHLGIVSNADPWIPVSFPEIEYKRNYVYFKRYFENAELDMEVKVNKKNPFLSLPSLFFLKSFFIKDILKKFLLFLPAVFVILFLGYMFFGGSEPVSPHKSIKEITKILNELNVQGVQFSTGKNKKVSIVGYVQTKQERKRVIHELEKEFIVDHCTIYVIQQLIDSSVEVISNMNLPLSAEYKEDGIVVLNGFVEKNKDIQDLLLKLKQNVAGIKQIDNRVLVQSKLINEFIGMMADLNIDGEIDFKPYPEFFLAIGKMYKKDLQAWEEFKKKTYQKYGKYMVIKDDFKILEEDDVLPEETLLPVTP